MTQTHIYLVVAYLMLLSAGVTFLIGSRQHSKYLRPVLLLIFLSFGFDFTFRIAYDFFGIYIKYTGAIFRLLELILLLEFYTIILGIRGYKKIRRVIQLLAIIVFGYLLELNATPMRITNSLIFSILSIFYFIQITLEMKIDNPLRFPLFWINSAFLIYFSGSVFFSLFFEPLGKVNENAAILSFAFHNILGFAKNSLIAVAFLFSLKNPDWQKTLKN